MTVRIVTYNIRKGGALRRAAIAEVLESLDADVAVLQEATDPEVVSWLAETTGRRLVIGGRGRSVAVLARSARVVGRWHALPTGRAFAEVELADPRIRLIGVHLSAGLSARGERRRAREVGSVLAVAHAAPGPERTLIAGDLNAIAPSDTPRTAALPAWIRVLLALDGGISTTVVTRILADGFVDAFRLLNPLTPGATLPAAAPTVRLDYLMLGRSLVPTVTSCAIGDVPRSTLVAASDHLPVVVALDV